jgi:hypothetical protein
MNFMFGKSIPCYRRRAQQICRCFAHNFKKDRIFSSNKDGQKNCDRFVPNSRALALYGLKGSERVRQVCLRATQIFFVVFIKQIFLTAAKRDKKQGIFLTFNKISFWVFTILRLRRIFLKVTPCNWTDIIRLFAFEVTNYTVGIMNHHCLYNCELLNTNKQTNNI